MEVGHHQAVHLRSKGERHKLKEFAFDHQM